MKFIRTFLIAAPLAIALMTPAVRAADIPAEGAAARNSPSVRKEGKQVSLKDFRGQWVVLYFYPKDMTKGCTIEAHNFQADQDKYNLKARRHRRGERRYGRFARSILHQGKLTFKLLADPTHATVDKYGSFGGMMANRNTFLIDPKGVIRKVYTAVKPDPHSAEVLAELDTLQKK